MSSPSPAHVLQAFILMNVGSKVGLFPLPFYNVRHFQQKCRTVTAGPEERMELENKRTTLTPSKETLWCV
jgi:hypothetical protein